MNRLETVESTASFSLEKLCERIASRHRNKIRTQKPQLAVANLARIIKATLKLSNRKGFHATTLRDLARESGLSMGGLYSYIGSKDTLLLMILGEVVTTVQDVLNSAPLDVAANPAAHLRWLISAHVELTEKMLPWFVFSYLEARHFPEAAKKYAIESEIAVEGIFEVAIEHGVEVGIFSTPNSEFAATLIKPLLQDWYIKRNKYRKRSISPKAFADTVATFIEAALRAQHAP